MAVFLNNIKYKLHIGSSAFVMAVKNLINGTALKASDGSYVKTSDGFYLSVKENN